MHRLLVAIIALALAASCASVPGSGEGASVVPLDHLPALKGDYFRHESASVGRAFHIYVRLPADYSAQPERNYPIVYLLDGDSLFPIVAASHLFLTYDEQLPEAIVVGIAYGGFDPSINRRDVDFTLPGAAAFQSLLKTELIPLVERRYRADPARRILFGQSRGGFFILYSAFTDPDLFWGRIASNLSSDPGRDLFFGPPPAAARTDLRLIIASGSRDRPRTRDLALEWARAWERREDAPWAVRLVTIEGGTHSADSARAYRAGMLWLFGLPDPLSPL
ncbi:MAG TPA: alpha/beta hydrolase-fold protein [Allosphingosinicella sp.]|nr:alpha/beta hydrolase-fold protein [Allosphingosinicella sp.]